MATLYGANVVRDGLVLHLDAANVKSYPGSGTVWNGLTGNESNGLLVNGAAYFSNNEGYIAFDGVNDYASIETSNDISGNNPWTISIWANVSSSENSSGRQGWLIWQGTSNQTTNQLISMGVTSGAIEIAHWGNDTTFTNAAVDFNQWEQYVCTYDGTTEKVYVNGIQKASKTTSLSITAGTWYISSRAGVAEFLNNSVSSFQVYNRSISDSEIQQNFNATRGRFGI